MCFVFSQTLKICTKRTSVSVRFLSCHLSGHPPPLDRFFALDFGLLTYLDN
jgi:hypothetical protein